jgi:uncharacterized heparinase superfamily protein
MASAFRALRDYYARPARRWRGRSGGPPEVAESLPEPVFFGDADRGLALVGGTWKAVGREILIGEDGIWAAHLPDRRLEPLRQGFAWLDDLAALGNRVARQRARQWLLDWIRRYGRGRGPEWHPSITGARLRQWTAHAAMLAAALEPRDADRFWRAFAVQQRYLVQTWKKVEPGMPQLQALAGLVWSGVVLPHKGHRMAMAELGQRAESFIDSRGEVASRRPEDLAEALILLIWTARVLENAGQHAPPAHLSAIVRGVPVLRPLRMGDGSFARFHGGSQGDPDHLDQALAELRIGVQTKPPLSMGFCRLTGGRTALVLDGASPPSSPHASHAHASTLAFEMSVGRQPMVVNVGPGEVFGPAWSLTSRQTAAQSTVEIDGQGSALIRASGRLARGSGARLTGGPSLVSINQAQDATGQWLLATHDGYASRFGIIHERRAFVDARGAEVRGEDILSVPDARARTQFDRAARGKKIPYAIRFHIHPAVRAEYDEVRQLVALILPSGEIWVFRCSGGEIAVDPSTYLDPKAARPTDTSQIVVRGGLRDYLGQILWTFVRLRQAPPAEPADPVI